MEGGSSRAHSSPPFQERRERRKHETLAATSTSWDRPPALLKLWKHRRSACRNHCSPILTTFSCVGDGDKGRRITRPFKGFSTSFLIIGKSHGERREPRSLAIPWASSFRALLDRCLINTLARTWVLRYTVAREDGLSFFCFSFAHLLSRPIQYRRLWEKMDYRCLTNRHRRMKYKYINMPLFSVQLEFSFDRYTRDGLFLCHLALMTFDLEW